MSLTGDGCENDSELNLVQYGGERSRRHLYLPDELDGGQNFRGDLLLQYLYYYCQKCYPYAYIIK